MIGWLRNLLGNKESIDDLDPSVPHSQKGLDTESRAWLLGDFGLIPPFSLNGYLETYLTDDLAQAIVDADARLTVSGIDCVSEDDALCEYVNEFNRRIELPIVVYDIVRDCDIFGFSIFEIVGNGASLLDSTQILGLKRHDPRFIVIQKDQHGRFQFFKQRPGFAQGALSAPSPSFERRLDPQSIVYVRNTSPFTSYEQSLLQAISTQLQRRNDLLDAAVLAARNHANPTIHANYKTNPKVRETADEIGKHRDRLKKACERQQEQSSKFVVTAGKGEHHFTPIGHPTIPTLVPLIEHITTSALVAVGLNPQSLGFSFGSAATSFEASDRMLVNSIVTKQRHIVAQLQSKLYRLLPLIERAAPAGDILIRIKPPTMESLKEQYEADSILVNVVERRWRNGSLTADEGARMLGAHEIADKEKWDEWLNGSEAAEPNQDDPNDNQAIDAAVRSLNDGKQPSNNPGGGKA